ncbi:hypothetical protein V2J09_013581 [Rumex salicifolius]
MNSSGMNLVMTVIGFAVSTLFIVFVCTRLICARIQLRAARRSFRVPTRSNLSTLERGLHGLEAPVLANFPAKKYGDEYFSSLENAQCSVCLADYCKEDVLRILPHCGHYFHVNCIDIWLLQNSTCPVCRVSLREPGEKKRSMQPLFSSWSHRGVESANNLHTYHCLLTSHGFPSSSQVNRDTSLNQENQSISRVDSEEVEESINPLGGDCVPKDSVNDHLQTPSCA